MKNWYLITYKREPSALVSRIESHLLSIEWLVVVVGNYVETKGEIDDSISERETPPKAY